MDNFNQSNDIDDWTTVLDLPGFITDFTQTDRITPKHVSIGYYWCKDCDKRLANITHNFRCATCDSRIHWFCSSCSGYVDGARKSTHEKTQKHQTNLIKLNDLFLKDVLPESGPTRGNTFISLHGTGFSQLGRILWNGTPVKTYFCQEDYSLHCFALAGTGYATVSVVDGKGTSNTLLFEYSS